MWNSQGTCSLKCQQRKYSYIHDTNTTKINLKGQRKEWFGLLPVCCFKENTHGLNWVVLVYHRWTKQQFSPRAFHHYLYGVTKTTSCFGTGRSTVDFHQLCSILWLERFLYAFNDEKDGGCYESASCFENVARRRQQHGSFRLPVLLEVDSKEYSDPVVESTGEEWKKISPHSSLGSLSRNRWAMHWRLTQPHQPSRDLSDRKPRLMERLWGTRWGTNLCCCSMWAI